jgi:hypothetical protein
MTFLPHPSLLQRYMDDQSVLAARAPSAPSAHTHEAMAALYREQIVGLIRGGPVRRWPRVVRPDVVADSLPRRAVVAGNLGDLRFRDVAG